MINANETIIEQNSDGKPKINASATVIVSQTESSNASTEFISPGGMLNEYLVQEVISGTARARVYKVEKEGEIFVAKIFERGWQPVRYLRTFFLNNNHENIMRMIDSGRFLGMYYEIYPYYAEGTLESYVNQHGPIGVDTLRRVVVPSINEGLFFLHANAIVHCDIKPSNLYIEKKGDSINVIIGDFGSCQVIDKDGVAHARLEGTINYMTPLEDFGGYKVIPPAYDYVSFGLSVYWMNSQSGLMSGLEVDEMARLWDRVITIPVDDLSLRNLLEGLINKDLMNVWGYEEVRNWCERGINTGIKRKKHQKRHDEQKSMYFGYINGEPVNIETQHQLVNNCKRYWEQGKTVIQRGDTSEFIKQFDRKKSEMIESEQRERYSNEDILLFRILYQLERTNRICYKGEEIGTLIDLLERLKRHDPIAIDFVMDGMLAFYLQIMNAEPKDVSRLEDIIQMNRSGVLNELSTIDVICRAFMKDRILRVKDQSVDSLESFVDMLSGLSSSEIQEILCMEEVMKWFVALGFMDEVEQLKMMKG